MSSCASVARSTPWSVVVNRRVARGLRLLTADRALVRRGITLPALSGVAPEPALGGRVEDGIREALAHPEGFVEADRRLADQRAPRSLPIFSLGSGKLEDLRNAVSERVAAARCFPLERIWRAMAAMSARSRAREECVSPRRSKIAQVFSAICCARSMTAMGGCWSSSGMPSAVNASCTDSAGALRRGGARSMRNCSKRAAPM